MGKMQQALRKADGPADDAAGAIVTGGASGSFIGARFSRGDLDARLVVLTEPQSGRADQIRGVANHLVEGPIAQGAKVICVTSAVAGEGKSVFAANLACALAENTAKQIVLVDTDLRSPTQHALMIVDNTRGLSDYLKGGTMLELVLQRSRLPNLWVLPAGGEPSDPGEMLSGARMDDLMGRLRRDYDLVIVDTSSVLARSETTAVTPRADGTLLVVRMDRTPKDQSRLAVATLKQAKSHILGSVLTDV
jgi:capsular exopolysaccharide synthesis family protein